MSNKVKYQGTLRAYLRWPLVLVLLLLCMNLHIYFINVRAGMIMSAYVLVYGIIVAMIYGWNRKGLQRDLTKYAMDFGRIQKQVLKEMVLPFAILDGDGHMLWANDEFYQIAENKKAARKSIGNIFPEVTEDTLPKDAEDKELHVQMEDKNFKIVLRRMETGSIQENAGLEELDLDSLTSDNVFITMFVYDETELANYLIEKKEENLLVGLLYIDNYDESLESIDEVRRSLLGALVERKINKYMSSIDAIIKKMEKDKYVFVCKQKYLTDMQSTRFDLLEEIRAINIGNEMSVTISIGIGVSDATYQERYENARKAIDLALGRGGDQAVVKEGDRVQYYGGKSVQIERNTRVKARVKAHALRELIEGKEKVVVMGHSIGDADSFGASVGIYRIAKTLNRKAHVVINEVSNSVRPLVDRFLNNPEYEDDMIVTGEQAMEIVDENTVLVVVDTNKANYTECPELLTLTNSIVVLDHHRQQGEDVENAVLFYLEPYASSVCEMVSEIAQYIGGGLRLRSIEAEALYAGILIDTNHFSNQTGVRTFEAAAYLRRNGADAIRVRKMFRTDIDEYKIRGQAIQNTELYYGEFAITESGSEGIDSPTVVGAKIANELLEIKGVRASFVLTNYNGKIYISARSIDELNVQVMMERLGGGGHINAAGAQIADTTIDEAKNIIRQTIDQMKEEGEI